MGPGQINSGQTNPQSNPYARPASRLPDFMLDAPTPEPESKKGNKKLYIILGIVAAVVIIGSLIVPAIMKKNNKKPLDSTQSSDAQVMWDKFADWVLSGKEDDPVKRWLNAQNTYLHSVVKKDSATKKSFYKKGKELLSDAVETFQAVEYDGYENLQKNYNGLSLAMETSFLSEKDILDKYLSSGQEETLEMINNSYSKMSSSAQEAMSEMAQSRKIRDRNRLSRIIIYQQHNCVYSGAIDVNCIVLIDNNLFSEIEAQENQADDSFDNALLKITGPIINDIYKISKELGGK